MISTLAHIYRRPDISRDQFRAHYETRHTLLAKRLLPNFDHYVRNHLIESTAPDIAPDVISEFGYDDDDKLTETTAILGDERGRELLADELTFMDKPRNRIFVVQRTPRPSTTLADKYVLLLRGDTPAVDVWCAAWHAADDQLSHTLLCSGADSDTGEMQHWLFGWTRGARPLQSLQQELRERGLPVVWSARVSEHVGYPG